MYILIVNPEAGGGKGRKVYETLKYDPTYKEKDCRSFFTEYEGHATKLAMQIAHMYGESLKALIVIGGDGTVHEVMNGLVDYPQIKLGIIPAGSGNDFARGCNIKEKEIKLFKQILHNPSWLPYWRGKVTQDHGEKQKHFLFANSIGFGFDGEVARKSSNSKRSKIVDMLRLSSFRYVVALLQVLFAFKPKTMELTLDGRKKEFTNVWMVTVTNHPYFGGGMKIVPKAKVNKDYFYIFILDGISKWKVLFLFFTVYFGKHVNFKEVHIEKASNFAIKVDKGIDYQVDGEFGKTHECIIVKDQANRPVHRFSS